MPIATSTALYIAFPLTYSCRALEMAGVNIRLEAGAIRLVTQVAFVFPW